LGLPEPVEVLEWARGFDDTEGRIIGHDTLVGPWGPILVSTVFIGLDHDFTGTYPVLYETMIFNHPLLDGFQARYRTRSEAARGHLLALAAARRSRSRAKYGARRLPNERRKWRRLRKDAARFVRRCEQRGEH